MAEKKVTKKKAKPAKKKPSKSTSKRVGTQLIKRLIGMDEKAAEGLVVANGMIFRVVYADGESFIVTADFRPDRINVWLSGGIVTSANMG